MLHKRVGTASTAPRGTLSFVVLVAYFGTVLASTPALGQDAAGEGPKHPLRSGAWALEFELQPRLTGYYGAAGIAVKRHFTTRSALRSGFLVVINNSNGEAAVSLNTTTPYDTTVVSARREDSSDRRDVSLFLHFVRYLGVGDRFGMFLEAGPTVRWISEEYWYADANSYYPLRTYRSEADRDSWNYGADIAAGFEWFFSRRLSLGGRYGISGLRTDTDQTGTTEVDDPSGHTADRRVTHSDGLIVQTTPAIISLTAYF